MSSASSVRYQSRLFNFVRQQSRRLGESIQHKLRHLQVATKWTLEAILSSVYRLIEKAFESAGKQLQQELQRRELQLLAHDIESQIETSPSTDTPIQRVLEAVEKQPYHALKGHLLVVRGIASELVSRNLVLVSNENEILNILTLQQQEKLQDQILTEVASYWRYWRLSEEKDETEMLREIERLLTKLTDDSDIVDQMPALSTETESIPGRRIAKRLEVWGYTNKVRLAFGNVFSLRRRFSKRRFSKRRFANANDERGLPETRLRGFSLYSRDFQSPGIYSQNYYPARKLLNAAVTKLKSNALVPMQSAKLAVQQRSSEFIQVVQSQLNIFLYGKEQLTKSAPAVSALNIQALIRAAINFFFGDDGAIAQPQKSTRDLTPTQKTLAKIASGKQTALSVSQFKSESNKEEIFWQQSHQTTEVEAKPDWIETKAKTIGYELHPLEQILAWLDSVMLLLEEIFVKVFQSLHRLWELVIGND